MVSGLFVFLHFAPGSEVHRENFRSSGIFVPGNWERKVQELSLLVISVGDANKSSKIPRDMGSGTRTTPRVNLTCLVDVRYHDRELSCSQNDRRYDRSHYSASHGGVIRGTMQCPFLPFTNHLFCSLHYIIMKNCAPKQEIL